MGTIRWNRKRLCCWSTHRHEPQIRASGRSSDSLRATMAVSTLSDVVSFSSIDNDDPLSNLHAVNNLAVSARLDGIRGAACTIMAGYSCSYVHARTRGAPRFTNTGLAESLRIPHHASAQLVKRVFPAKCPTCPCQIEDHQFDQVPCA